MKNTNKQQLKIEKQKQLEKVIESHTLKYYGYFNIIFQLLIFLALVLSLFLSTINLFQNKKFINYIDTNKNIQETQAYKKEIEITPYVNFGITSVNTLKNNFNNLNINLDGSLSAKTWNGLSSFSGNNIWTDGTYIYYSAGNVGHYVLDTATNTWTAKTWNGYTSFSGRYVWTDGTNIYYGMNSNQYVLNTATSTWTAKTWNGLSSLIGLRFWTDGTYIYYSASSNQYVLNTATSTWTAKTWNGLSSFNGNNVWTDGSDIYYSNGSNQYVLDTATSTWTAKTWNGLSSFNGNYIWTDGSDIYYSNFPEQYVLDTATSTWTAKTWPTNELNGDNVWTDGNNIYYSDTSNQYVFDIQSITQLTTPTLQFRYVNNYNYLSWLPISNATTYAVYKDNVLITDSNTTFYSDGTYINYAINSTGTYYVVAIGDNTNYIDSNNSNSVTLPTSQLATPTNFVFSSLNQYLSWSSVTNADSYSIYKNNTLIDTTTNTTYSINSSGSYYVVATNNSLLYSNSSPTSSINLHSISSSTSLSSSDNINCNTTFPYYITSADVLVSYFTITSNNTNGYFLTGNTYISTQNNASISQNITSDKTLTATIMNVTEDVTFSITYTTAIKLDLSVTNGSISDVTINSVSQAINSVYYLNSSTDILTFTATANTGYIYDTFNGGLTYSHLLVSQVVGDTSYKTISLTSFSTGATFNIEFVEAILLTGQWAFVGSRNYTYDTLPTYSINIEIDFTSNGEFFDGIVWNTAYQNISYTTNSNNPSHSSFKVFTYTFDIPNLYFSGFLYVPQNTANYLFIDFDTIEHDVYINSNLYNDYFVKLYRVATNEDYANLGYQNGVINSNQYSMANLLFALFDTPVITLRSLLNFNFFGVNLFALFTLILTLLVLFAVMKFFKGGKDDDKK